MPDSLERAALASDNAPIVTELFLDPSKTSMVDQNLHQVLPYIHIQIQILTPVTLTLTPVTITLTMYQLYLSIYLYLYHPRCGPSLVFTPAPHTPKPPPRPYGRVFRAAPGNKSSLTHSSETWVSAWKGAGGR